MVLRSFLPALLSALSLLVSASPGFAQETPTQEPEGATPPSERVLPGRIGGDRNDRRQRREAAVAAQPTPEQIKAAAQVVATAAGADCQVSEAVNPGMVGEAQAYEVACNAGPGYLLIASTPPQKFDCVELAGQALTAREKDPNADVGQQCAMPVNQDVIRVIGAYAKDAGIACTTDQGAAIAKSTGGNLIYEIGCADADGYWIEKVAQTWKVSPCWDLSFDNQTCRFTTPTESLSAWKTILAGTDAAACDVTQGRRVGRDAQGLTVYEVKCGAGDGFFARVGEDHLAKRVHPCAQAANIGGGCTLTPVAAAPAPTAAPTTQQ